MTNFYLKKNDYSKCLFSSHSSKEWWIDNGTLFTNTWTNRQALDKMPGLLTQSSMVTKQSQWFEPRSSSRVRNMYHENDLCLGCSEVTTGFLKTAHLDDHISHSKSSFNYQNQMLMFKQWLMKAYIQPRCLFMSCINEEDIIATLSTNNILLYIPNLTYSPAPDRSILQTHTQSDTCMQLVSNMLGNVNRIPCNVRQALKH